MIAWRAAAIAIGLAGSLVAHAERLPQRHALLIGLNDYEWADGPISPLKYALSDVDALEQAFKTQGFRTIVLKDRAAKRENIVSELARYAGILIPDDTFLLYYAGHGIRNTSNQHTYWLNFDGNPKRPDVHGIRLTHMLDYVRDIPANRKIVLLDHCYSGDLVRNEALSPIGTRDSGGVLEIVAARDGELLEDVSTLGERMAQRQHQALLIAASRGLAHEVAREGHGVFTSALLRALATDEADQPEKDGAVSVPELIQYLRARMSYITADLSIQQVPVSKYTGSFESALSWRPFLRTLDSDETLLHIARHRGVLQRWQLQGRISPQVGAESSRALDQWESSAGLSSDRDRAVIFAIREALELEVQRPEDYRAQMLERHVRSVVGGL